MNPEEVIRTVYKAFNARDVEAVLRHMEPDVDWPNGMEGGRVHGHEGVREYWDRQWKIVDPHVEPLRIETDEAGLQVVTVHQVVRDLAGQVLLDRPVQHIYSMENGLIRRMDIREAAAAEAAGTGAK
jgi:limonene-1,2-epoxide hydrolase